MPVDLSDIRPKMEKAFESFRGDISSIQTGRATPALVENLMVSAYEGTQHLRLLELATISVPDPRSLLIQPWDATVLGEIRKAIEAANIGLTPILENSLIRISLPPLSVERRQEYVKLLGTKIEAARVGIRQIRHERMADLKKSFEEKELDEDSKFRMEKELQEITDEFIAKIEELGKRKEEELLQI